MDILKAQEIVLKIGMIFLSITALFCLIRAILGPRFTDRILGVNMINVKTIILISMFSVIMKRSYIVDISLVYAAISFLSVVVLARIFINLRLKNKKLKDN